MASAGRPAVEVRGVTELQVATRRMASRLDDRRAPDRAAADAVRGAALARVPVVSGALAGSIAAEPGVDGGILVAAGGPTVPYAGPIHYGWRERNIEPQPFLTDALDAALPEVEAAYSAYVGDLVGKWDREAP